jgi:drug/metabolite transporter (DMT)-like permease
MHAAVVTGVLPLATAAVAALALRQRASAGFWGCAVAGCALVLGLRPGRAVAPVGGRRLLLLAVLCGAIGYVGGAQVSASLPAPAGHLLGAGAVAAAHAAGDMWWLQPQQPASTAAWVGFAYVSLFSMWLGFFAWYRGLALGGVMRVSQVQLLQPFLALLFAVPILGERLDPATLGFALAVMAVVFVGRRMPAGTSR